MVGGLTIVQAKKHTRVLGVSHIRELIGAMDEKRAGRGILVMTSWFTSGCWTKASEKRSGRADRRSATSMARPGTSAARCAGRSTYRARGRGARRRCDTAQLPRHTSPFPTTPPDTSALPPTRCGSAGQRSRWADRGRTTQRNSAQQQAVLSRDNQRLREQLKLAGAHGAGLALINHRLVEELETVTRVTPMFPARPSS